MPSIVHGLPLPPTEPPVNRALDCLAPRFHARVISVLSRMKADGYDPIVSESCRSNERQAWLYGFGREWDDGRGVVTMAPTVLHTWHGYGLAVDVISQTRAWDASAHFWQSLGEAALAHGLAWGGSWARFTDKPHIQFGIPMRQSPSSRAAQLLADGGVRAVWAEVHAL